MHVAQRAKPKNTYIVNYPQLKREESDTTDTLDSLVFLFILEYDW